MRERTGYYSDDCSVSVVAFTSCLSRRRRRRRNGRRCPGAAACLLPSWFFARWRKSKDEKKKKAPGQVSNGESPLPLQLVDSGGQKEASFNVGIGLGLMYAIAGCRNELNKIVDLRLQFETLIQTYNKAQNQQLPSTPSDVSTLSNLSSFSNTDSHENFKDNGDCCGRHMKCNKKMMSRRRNVGSSEMMDELEAELVAELSRLQLDLDSDVTSRDSTQHNEIIIGEENEARQNERFGGVEDIEIDTRYSEYELAVSPYELEIRLHEVLKERQEERIEELESALESAMEMLHQKDEELSWWKDTANLISQHVSNVPRFS
ncbi:PREDICTED: protein POLAR LOCALIZATION DURING ASYMMETRIC DIVISION AND REDISTRIBUTION-like [Ipomoea nil]|uniref:protein POLAR LOCALIZATION DURING ASYMMETRIC DIVISION AND REDISTRIBUTION-like n=1 Tax=Ipomoea nil TaxID=35883 RepID=UPI0009016392|nr:PREDICTED: protein POLAR LOCALIZATION DURING ASYMMETRIC DIVISION AND REDISTRIBUTION-like [Ipomoea nil]